MGLKMTFSEDEGEIISVWDPSPHYQGYWKVLHGGIQATLMDEIASWVVYVHLHTGGFTSRADVRYRKPVYVDQGALTLRARCAGMRRNLADIEVRLFDHAQNLCAEGSFTYFTYPMEKARDQMFYPGPSAFFEETT